jgi:peptidoglycan/LPS O-acetylase OafA/YrhL
MGRHLGQLDILRGIAILAVIAYHASNHLKWAMFSNLVNYGWCGVDLFFVISGFLITGILLKSRNDGGYFVNFYMRRVLRIWPLYFAFLFLMLVLLPTVAPGAMAQSAQSAQPAWSFPLFLQNLLVQKKIVGPLGITWSLAIEEQFYMAWPFFVWKLSRPTLKRLLIAILTVEPVLRILLTHFNVHISQYTHTLTRLDGLAVGCLLALLYENYDPAIWHWRALQFGSPALGVAVICARFQYRPLLYSAVAMAMGCAVAYSLTIRTPSSKGLLVYTGRISYGLYLLHLLAFDIFDSAKMRTKLHGNIGYLLASLVLTYALASISFFAYEAPINKFKRFFRGGSQVLVGMYGAGGQQSGAIPQEISHAALTGSCADRAEAH